MNLRPPNTIAILVGTPKGIRNCGKPPDFQNIDLEIALDVAHPRTCEPPDALAGFGVWGSTRQDPPMVVCKSRLGVLIYFLDRLRDPGKARPGSPKP